MKDKQVRMQEAYLNPSKEEKKGHTKFMKENLKRFKDQVKEFEEKGSFTLEDGLNSADQITKDELKALKASKAYPPNPMGKY